MIETLHQGAQRVDVREWASSESDEVLVRRWQRGDLAAASITIQRHERLVYAAALHLVHNATLAEDICQDAFLRAHERIGSLREPARFAAWVRRISVRLAVDTLRRRQTDLLSEEEPDPNPTPAEAAEISDAVDGLIARLTTLPLSQRAAVILRDVEDFSTVEAAQLLGISEAAFKMRLSRARATLRAQYDASKEKDR